MSEPPRSPTRPPARGSRRSSAGWTRARPACARRSSSAGGPPPGRVLRRRARRRRRRASRSCGSTSSSPGSRAARRRRRPAGPGAPWADRARTRRRARSIAPSSPARGSAPSGSDVARLPPMLERMGGLQAQYAPSMYIGPWSRLERLRARRRSRARSSGSASSRATLMRGDDPPRLARRDYWPLAARRSRDGAPRARGCAHAPRRLERARRRAAAARALCATRSPAAPRCGSSEIDALVGKTAARGVGLWLDLVRAPPSGTWERRRAGPRRARRATGSGRRADRPRRRPSSTSCAATSAASARPPRKDVAYCAGPPPRTTSRARAPGAAPLRAEDGERAARPPARAAARPRHARARRACSATWDAILLVHARRTGILREQHRADDLPRQTPQSSRPSSSTATVAGTWRYENGMIDLGRRSAPCDVAHAPRARRRGGSGRTSRV